MSAARTDRIVPAIIPTTSTATNAITFARMFWDVVPSGGFGTTQAASEKVTTAPTAFASMIAYLPRCFAAS